MTAHLCEALRACPCCMALVAARAPRRVPLLVPHVSMSSRELRAPADARAEAATTSMACLRQPRLCTLCVSPVDPRLPASKCVGACRVRACFGVPCVSVIPPASSAPSCVPSPLHAAHCTTTKGQDCMRNR